MTPRTYPVPWRAVFDIGPNMANGTRASVDAFSRAFVERQPPGTRVEGLEHLATSPRFIIAANHYQRKGLWIAHPASVITQAVRRHYGLDDPPMHWIVTGNWPPLRIGPLRMPSPGDFLLPKVAHALACFAVPFQGSDPGATARSILKLLRTVPRLDRPIGLFPEGAHAHAGVLAAPLPGIDRLLKHLAKRGLHVQPAGISEQPGLTVRFGPAISAAHLEASEDAASLVMSAIGRLCS